MVDEQIALVTCRYCGATSALPAGCRTELDTSGAFSSARIALKNSSAGSTIGLNARYVLIGRQFGRKAASDRFSEDLRKGSTLIRCIAGQ